MFLLVVVFVLFFARGLPDKSLRMSKEKKENWIKKKSGRNMMAIKGNLWMASSFRDVSAAQ